MNPILPMIPLHAPILVKGIVMAHALGRALGVIVEADAVPVQVDALEAAPVVARESVLDPALPPAQETV